MAYSSRKTLKFFQPSTRNYYTPLIQEAIGEEIYANVSFLKRKEERLMEMFDIPFSNFNKETKKIFIQDLLDSSDAVQQNMLKNQFKLGVVNLDHFQSELKSLLSHQENHRRMTP